MLKEIFYKACAESAEVGGHADINFLCGLQAVYEAGRHSLLEQEIVEIKCLNCYGYNVPDYCEETPLGDICDKFKLWKK